MQCRGLLPPPPFFKARAVPCGRQDLPPSPRTVETSVAAWPAWSACSGSHRGGPQLRRGLGQPPRPPRRPLPWQPEPAAAAPNAAAGANLGAAAGGRRLSAAGAGSSSPAPPACACPELDKLHGHTVPPAAAGGPIISDVPAKASRVVRHPPERESSHTILPRRRR